MATWPATLPAPQRNGYGGAPVDPTLRTDMEVGASRARRRTAALNDRVTVAWVFTDAQFAIFRAWFDDAAEADGGAAWFALLLPIGKTGATLQDVRFVGAFQYNQIGLDCWSVTARLEVRDA